MIINNYIYNINDFKSNIYNNAKTYVCHSNRNGITCKDIKLCLCRELALNNFNIHNEAVFKLNSYVNVIDKYITNIELFDKDIYIDCESNNPSYNIDSENPFFDIFTVSVCQCKLCTNISANINLINEPKLNDLILSINI